MPKKSRRSSSRKVRHTRKHRVHRRRSVRRRGGVAPVGYSLSGSWPSQMSLGQGGDYFNYHKGQHGGVAPLESIGQVLPAPLRAAAHVGGIDTALRDVAGLKDQAGGKRRKHRKSSKKHRKTTKKSRKHAKKSHKKSHRRRRGGALGYAPFPSQGMLLNSPKAYAQAGLNPEWKTDVAFADAKIRDTQ
jgi:hypothetical protein